MQLWRNWRRSGFLFVTYQSFNLVYYHIAIHVGDLLHIIFGRPKKVYSLRQLAKKYNVPYIKSNDVRESRFVKAIKEANPDLIISFYFDHIIRQNIIEIPSMGIINVHTAPLPMCKGPFPILCSVIKDLKGVVSIHKVENETLDSGALCTQEPYNLDYNRSILYHDRESMIQGALMILELISQTEKTGEIPFAKKQEGSGSYMSFPTKSEVESLRKKGVRLFRLSDFTKAF